GSARTAPTRRRGRSTSTSRVSTPMRSTGWRSRCGSRSTSPTFVSTSRRAAGTPMWPSRRRRTTGLPRSSTLRHHEPMGNDTRPDDQQVVDALEEVWRRIAGFGAELREDDWKLPTEVPGWTVQDNLAHLTDIESMLLGRPRPEHVVPDGLAHVKNEPG